MTIVNRIIYDDPDVKYEVLQLYNIGYNDRLISKNINKRLGTSLSPKSITKWRKLNNLPAKRVFGKPVCNIFESHRTQDRVRRLIISGETIENISIKLGITYSLIIDWLNSNNITSVNVKKKLNNQDHEHRLKLYNQGLTDEKLGELEGVCSEAIYYWRKRNKLPANYGRK